MALENVVPLAASDSFAAFVRAWNFTGALTALVALAAGGYVIGLIRLQWRGRGRAVSRSRVIYAGAGLFLLSLSLIGPLDAYAERAFFIHMTQHLVLAMLAAPLMLAASPVSAYLWALPEAVRLGIGAGLARQGLLRRAATLLTKPVVALLAFVGTFYVWHLPAAYNAALENGAVHFIEHVTMFASGVLFWWPLIGPAPVRSPLSYPQRMLYLLLVVTPKALLGAIITLSGHVLYGFYLDAPDLWGISDQEDQNIAGLIMWVPGNFVFLAALTVLFFKWYEQEEGPLDGRRPPRQSPGAGGPGA